MHKQGAVGPGTEEGVVVGRVWDGSNVAQELVENVRQQIVHLQHEGRPPPTLAEIRVGEWPSDERIRGLQAEACRVTGVAYQVYVFPQLCDPQTILQSLADLNADPTIAGIAIHAHPATRLSEFAAALAPEKDVDGLHPLHLGRFLTNKRVWRQPRGADIVQLLKRAGLTLMGAHVICIGNAAGFAGILAWLCLHENATVSAWTGTNVWPINMLHQGDVLIIDTDNLPAMDGAALKPGVVVVDARRRPNGWLPHQPEGLPQAVSLLIPVPGGIGPTTPAMRLASLVAMYRAPAIVSLDS
jgi:methylenetetrahydrofolate dehydrogenase (NADP+) / methenyltetrahydrofolate cyclohydrolase